MSSNLRLGVFIVGALTLLAVASFLIGQRQFLFSRTYELQSTFHNVKGLTEGAEVRVGGIHKGVVKEIQLPREPSSETSFSAASSTAAATTIRRG